MTQRENKFRAWDKKDKKWVYCVLGIGEAEYEFDGEFNWHDLEPWQQFTGLLDKAGKPIYEGDIVEAGEGEHLEVIWRDEFGAYQLYRKSYSKDFPVSCVIIGNLYENPELLST